MPTILTKANFRQEIDQYLARLATLRLPTLPAEPIPLFQELKRGTVAGGPYPSRSLFEVANRVMSDLVVYGAAETLLTGPPPEILRSGLSTVTVLFGIEDGWDISATLPGGGNLLGECFNVAPSFFASKFRMTRKALAGVRADVKLVAFNREARTDLTGLERWKEGGLHFLPIDVVAHLDRWQRHS